MYNNRDTYSYECPRCGNISVDFTSGDHMYCYCCDKLFSFQDLALTVCKFDSAFLRNVDLGQLAREISPVAAVKLFIENVQCVAVSKLAYCVDRCCTGRIPI